MWQKKESKLELAASMIRQVMPEFQEKSRVLKALKQLIHQQVYHL